MQFFMPHYRDDNALPSHAASKSFLLIVDLSSKLSYASWDFQCPVRVMHYFFSIIILHE